MHELGTNKILVCSNVQPTTIHNDDIVAGDLFALGEVAKKHDVQVGYEALAWGIPADRIDGWTLHFRSIFGFRHDADMSLPDLYGLMKSRLVRSENGAIRIPLNASDNQNTVVSRSMANYKGSGVQHIAFASDDIFSTVKTLRENGAQLLDIPENYYDDLQARFDLDDAFVAKLRAHHMLYDIDGKGSEFLHVYSQIIENRFFLEVIQRIGGYDAYGAANTPVRLVAQDLHWKKVQAALI